MSPNVDLLRRTLNQIETNPGTWDQTIWAVQRRTPDGAVCGTAYCFAGWAVQLAGHRITFDDAPAPADTGRTASGEFIDEVARRELGLDESQAAWLFKASNTLGTLQSIVGELIAEAEADAGAVRG